MHVVEILLSTFLVTSKTDVVIGPPPPPPPHAIWIKLCLIMYIMKSTTKQSEFSLELLS